MGENSSISDDGLEMKRHMRSNANSIPYSVETRPYALRQGVTSSENHHLHPSYQRKDSRRRRGGERSDRSAPQVPWTRFTEPKPIDLNVLTMGLERDSSSTTLGSTHNGHSCASSATSEAVPVSTAPSSVAPTPEHSTMIAYFPSDTENHQALPTKKPATGVSTTPSLSETSVDSAVELPEELDKELEAPEPDTLNNMGEKNQATPKIPPAPVARPKSKKSRWSWRRSNSGAGTKLIASH